ncbi:MAG: DUF1971 domain-containing protein [Gammaproteobacteria bacterium]|jgi:tellurite resistance-related uncharacterized protein|nr:DUF1971 domain-containing protein [Gammaproteobacteria bacterium]MDP6536395.1 DUF1971 domain-containing protein [Gammaproteobacteria bacterium]MDP6731667.1 DUF1971 domain-containing protein [Gammaproteobacteria bacterium]HAJ76802.1 tellurite resistance protein [Gammaproteobacteria bacterium]|tara:strand:+ start:1088 stop:1366 length:279 start_codon:yes stop_codon:yes gene_type:complete
MKEIPASASSYMKTREFTEDTVPAGLLKAHKTKEGTWAKINVTEGLLHYRILEPEFEEVLLSSEKYGVVEPTILHDVEPKGKVRFHLEFFRD